MDWLGPVLLGLPTTVLITALSFVLGAVLAVPLMFGLRARRGVLRLAARGLVDIVRGVPVIVWLFVLYFGVSLGNFRFSSLAAAVVGLGVVSAAYLAEVYRGAMLAIPAGQEEAADALGFTRVDKFLRILAPQAVRIALPSATTYAIGLLKDSSIASVIGVTEIVFRTQAQTRILHGGLELYIIAALAYLALSLPLGLLSRWFDARLRKTVST